MSPPSTKWDFPDVYGIPFDPSSDLPLSGRGLREDRTRMTEEESKRATFASPRPEDAPADEGMQKALGIYDLPFEPRERPIIPYPYKEDIKWNSTQLTPEQDKGYQKFAKQIGVNPKEEEKDYDLPGYYKWWSGLPPDLRPPVGQGFHLSDKFKKPNHPTFSDESNYDEHAIKFGLGGEHGGKWYKAKDGKDVFVPGVTNYMHHTKEQLQEYFNQREPNSRLVMRDQDLPAALEGETPRPVPPKKTAKQQRSNAGKDLDGH